MTDPLPPRRAAEAFGPPPTETRSFASTDVSIAFDHPVLDDISFQLPRGETKILMGVAGTGKTLILKLALGLLKPDSGRIKVLDDEISEMREQELFALRRKHGMVFQESALFDSLTVEENVAYRLIEETGESHRGDPRSRAGGAALRGTGAHGQFVSRPSFPAACGGA